MTLHDDYPPAFEALWLIYPRWPTGRSKKRPSYLAFQAANRVLKFTQYDLAAIADNIKQRVIDCETWQPGNKFGPVMMATFMNQRLWAEPYEKKGRDRYSVVQDSAPAPELTAEQRMRADAARDRALQSIRNLGLPLH